MRNSTPHLPPSMAMARSREPAELLRVAEAWNGVDPHSIGLSLPAWDAAGVHLEAGQVPLLAGAEGAALRFRYPDGTTVLIDQRFYVRSGDRCSCETPRCRHQLAALRALAENRFRRSWRSVPILAATPAAHETEAARPVVSGLVISEDTAPAAWNGPRLVIRPSRRTAKGTWHQQLTWDDLEDGRTNLPLAQQSVLSTLERWRRNHRPGILLDTLGPELWALLDSARRAGLEVAADGEHLQLSETPRGIDLHIERADGGIVLRGAPAWEPGEEPAAWTLLGAPAHSLLAEHPEHPERTVLHRLDADAETLALMRTREVWIPETDLEEFSRTTLPYLISRPGVRLTGDREARALGDGADPDGEEQPGLFSAATPEIRWELTEIEDPDWLDLHGTVTLGDRQIPLVTLITALRSGQPCLVIGWWVLDLETPPMQRLRTLLELAAALPDEESLRLSRHDLTTWEQLAALEGIQADAARWRTLLHGIRPVDLTAEPLDDAVDATLRPYQLEGYRWLSARWDAGLGGILADDMGLGKTLQLLAAIRRHRRTDDRPVLVVAPRSVLGTWAQQAAQFVPDLRVKVITSTLREDLDPAEVDVVVVSHQLLRLDSARYQRLDWAALVLDEAQAAKNPASQLHRALREQHRDVTFVVTGTPVENSLQDLWALVALAAPGLLPSLGEFTRDWRRPIERRRDRSRLEQLRARIAPLLLRRTKELVASDLPPKLETTLTLPLAPAHINRYTTALNKERQRMLGLLDDPELHRVEILASLTRLRLLATDPGTVQTPSAKVRELIDRLEELAGSGHRALVFSQFAGHLRTVREILEHRGITTALLDGSTSSRERVVEEFRTGAQRAFLISLKAGGTGLTLVEADYVFLLDPWWNPAAEEQAIDRTHRIGQDSAVTVYRLVSAQTIEEKFLDLQETKRELITSVMEPHADLATALDATQLRELLEAEPHPPTAFS